MRTRHVVLALSLLALAASGGALAGTPDPAACSGAALPLAGSGAAFAAAPAQLLGSSASRAATGAGGPVRDGALAALDAGTGAVVASGLEAFGDAAAVAAGLSGVALPGLAAAGPLASDAVQGTALAQLAFTERTQRASDQASTLSLARADAVRVWALTGTSGTTGEFFAGSYAQVNALTAFPAAVLLLLVEPPAAFVREEAEVATQAASRASDLALAPGPSPAPGLLSAAQAAGGRIGAALLGVGGGASSGTGALLAGGVAGSVAVLRFPTEAMAAAPTAWDAYALTNEARARLAPCGMV